MVILNLQQGVHVVLGITVDPNEYFQLHTFLAESSPQMVFSVAIITWRFQPFIPSPETEARHECGSHHHHQEKEEMFLNARSHTSE